MDFGILSPEVFKMDSFYSLHKALHCKKKFPLPCLLKCMSFLIETNKFVLLAVEGMK